jgi:HD superfamily phosphohydrolase
MAKRRSIRDPLYGFIELTEAEWAIVNSRPFQRLRDIRQLGMGHMVYPGANHTRFEHSLGTVHVTSRMFDHLRARTSHEDWGSIF